MAPLSRIGTPLCLALIAGFLIVLTGCGETGSRTVDQIRVVDGAEQCALPGKAFARPVKIELLGPQEPGLLGGKGSRSPAAGSVVLFEPADGSDLKVDPEVVKTDEGGGAVVTVTAGKTTGDQYLRIIPKDAPDRSVTLRFITGMQIDGDNEQYRTGSVSAEPLSVKLVKPDGSPAQGVAVNFDLLATAEGARTNAKILTPTAVTNADGIAETEVKLGDRSGVYNIGISVVSPEEGFLIQNKTVKLLGFNIISVVIAVLGGLALFVFGMELMGDGIQKIAGENMKKVLQFFARNGIVAVLAGTLVTAVIQSSSATTVMVIGFINAGLLNLSQAIGIIFGANIGTTVTAQIVSFNVSTLAMPAIIAGLLLFFIPYRNCRGIGETVLGFGFLFYGMVLMSDELTRIADFPTVTRLFSHFDCTPLDGVMPFGAVIGALCIGLVVTMIIQSSSASTGIIIALGAGGLINLYTAMPLVLGANIGTTVTAQLAAIPANRVAKQAALAHTLFNVAGTLIMLVFFYVPWGATEVPVFFHIVDAITPGDAFSAIPQNVPRHIANAHTLFNVFTAVILLPFVMPLAHVCERLIPAKRKIKYTSLDPYLLENPPIALHQTVTRLRTMTRSAWSVFEKTMRDTVLNGGYDAEKREEYRKRESKIDRMQEEITAYLVQLAQRELTLPQSRMIPVLTHCANDAERLADYAELVLKEAARLAERREKFSKKSEKELRTLFDLTGRMASKVLAALEKGDEEPAGEARELGREIRQQVGRMVNAYPGNLRKGSFNVESGIIFLSLAGIFRQAAERLDNIAVRASSLTRYEWEERK